MDVANSVVANQTCADLGNLDALFPAWPWKCGTWDILVTLILFGAVASFLAHDMGTMVAALVIAFIISLFGLPLIAAVAIELLRGFNRTLGTI